MQIVTALFFIVLGLLYLGVAVPAGEFIVGVCALILGVSAALGVIRSGG